MVRRGGGGYVWCYVTASNRREARKLARAAVEDRLAACANILGPISSVYWWNGRLEESREVAVVFKTRRANLAALTARLRALHSYECPCIVALPIVAGNPAFLDWIGREARG